jgi:hypothetical protein
MSASIAGYWPERTEEDLDEMPGFHNDDQAWANWMAEVQGDEQVSSALRALGCEALLSHISEGMSEKEVDWTTPKELEAAALTLAERARQGDPRTGPVVEAYQRGIPADEQPIEWLLRDLADIAGHARHAAIAGATTFTLEVNW